MNKHLVYLIGEDWFFASHFLARARAARDAGWRISVLTRAGETAAALREDGFSVIGVDFVRARLNPAAEFLLLANIVTQYRNLRPDLVHHVALKPILLGSIAARIAKVPAIVNAPVGQGFVFASDTPKARLLRPLVRMALRATIGARGAYAVFENDEDRAAMVASGAVRRENAVLIPGAGVDLARFRPHEPPSEPVRVVLGARMLRDKGVIEFIEAAQILNNRGLDADFILAGAPDPGNPASLTGEEIRAARGVRWIGKCDDMAGLLASSHIACLPSYREGLPKFLLEAMASGLPCVATDVTGCRDAVIDGETGLLVPPRDARALAEALARLIGDASLRARLGAAGRARAQRKFADSVVCDRTLAVYERAIGQGVS
ncbi:glycosyltransferase family 4 protein [Acidiphilium sp. AL]|uniref:Glycosyltransferase family 4 protein n=1 Tax=Acidiphilium iwatense TaxID=768198 RepID=A0ABS9DWM6_9PROT|nr:MULTISPECIES: glycosyltransferase family 4 protein [Acidiphilium]MCF3946091.1 glycosyltransferase family 4 protein [Acidiphilium iwatense]MCU4162065.1 glycosyltransferase family 4 protein [Acidiphilium sp. AL]